MLLPTLWTWIISRDARRNSWNLLLRGYSSFSLRSTYLHNFTWYPFVQLLRGKQHYLIIHHHRHTQCTRTQHACTTWWYWLLHICGHYSILSIPFSILNKLSSFPVNFTLIKSLNHRAKHIGSDIVCTYVHFINIFINKMLLNISKKHSTGNVHPEWTSEIWIEAQVFACTIM